jgi:hypothetical protein
MCIDFIKLNKATRKDHYPLSFIDQMLEILFTHSHFCYLDGYSGFSQIPMHTDDQVKTTFTCEQLTNINVSNVRTTSPWFADYANFIAGKVIPPHFSYQQRNKFFYDLRQYLLDDPILYNKSVDDIIRRCLPEFEQQNIIRLS